MDVKERLAESERLCLLWANGDGAYSPMTLTSRSL